MNIQNHDPPRVVVPEHWLAPSRERLFFLKKKKSDSEFYAARIEQFSAQGIQVPMDYFTKVRATRPYLNVWR